jgi:hypothetical protein
MLGRAAARLLAAVSLRVCLLPCHGHVLLCPPAASPVSSHEFSYGRTILGNRLEIDGWRRLYGRRRYRSGEKSVQVSTCKPLFGLY